MQQEDYLIRQIDQLGKALGILLADLLRLKTQGQVSEGIQLAGQTLKVELGLDPDDLVSLPAEQFISKLKEEKKLSNENFDTLADLLVLFAEDPGLRDTDPEKREKFYDRALLIYEYLDKTDSAYSYYRKLKIDNIKKALA
jgi:hypothetical protein